MISEPASDAAAYTASLPAPVAAERFEKELSRYGCTAAEALGKGLVFAWPKHRGAIRYWHTDPDLFVRERMIKVARRTAMKRADLVAAVSREAHHCGRIAAARVLRSLMNEGVLKEARMGGLRLCYAEGFPNSLIAPALEPALSTLRRLGVEDNAILERLGGSRQIVPAVEIRVAERATALGAEIYLAATRLQKIPGLPVPIRELRSTIRAEKAEFDAAVLSLADAQKVYLTTHDHGWALPEPEREHLVWDGGQKLYVALTIRD